MIAEKNTIKFDGDVYDARHGGAFDRGMADSYYGRNRDPHYYVGDTYRSDRVKLRDTDPAYWDYLMGYEYNEQSGDRKIWG